MRQTCLQVHPLLVLRHDDKLLNALTRPVGPRVYIMVLVYNSASSLPELCRDMKASIIRKSSVWTNHKRLPVEGERETAKSSPCRAYFVHLARRCELFLMWSPQGTYLTTFHVPGIALWGGEQFEKQGRFPHKDVKVRLYPKCVYRY